MNFSKYLTNGAITAESYDQILFDAWEQNWTLQQVKDAMQFLQTYPVVACVAQFHHIMQAKRSATLSALQRVMFRHYSQRLQDLFKTKEEYL